MNGGTIASVVAPHTPRMGVEEKAPDFVRELIQGQRRLGVELRELEPDLFVVQSAHWVTTFDWFVAGQEVHEGVCVADEAPDLIPGTRYRRTGDPEFAKALVARLGAAEIPCGLNDSPHFQWDYGSLVPLQYMDPDATVPVVLLPSVICSDLEENMKVGRLVAETAVELERRVIFVSSCALSHKLERGPELWPSEAMQRMDRRLLDLLCAGQVEELIAWMPTFSRDAVAEMGGRTLCGMVGAMAAMAEAAGAVSGKQYGPYRQSSGTGNATVCVTPVPTH